MATQPMATQAVGPDLPDRMRRRRREVEGVLRTLEREHVTGQDPAGLVTLQLDGAGRVTRAEVSPRAWDSLPAEALGEHVLAALVAAQERAVAAFAEVAPAGLGLDLRPATLRSLRADLRLPSGLTGTGTDQAGCWRVTVGRSGVRRIELDPETGQQRSAAELAAGLRSALAAGWWQLGHEVVRGATGQEVAGR
ncbi:MAG TPA: YbaB/EbfC family nucleoid-associated protein [Mycobacteriales bacterium]|nr:YbaB/EbfC family nucleoid-associated protein [Mycobacteriales bacterium]